MLLRKNGVLGRGPNPDLSIGNCQPIGNSWIVQSDAGCFPDGTDVLGYVIKDPTKNIFSGCCKVSFFPCRC